MAQITSREELEEWLKDKPIDWAQIIAARAALRALPYAFAEASPQKWVNKYALSLLRAVTISWAARNFPGHGMVNAAFSAFSDAAAAAQADSAILKASAANDADAQFTIATLASDRTVNVSVASAVANAANANSTAHLAVYTAAAAAFAAATADNAAAATAAYAALWANVEHDCNWLETKDDRLSSARRLTHSKLWAAGEPEAWDEVRTFATKRLAALKDENDRNQHYQIWIEWYKRRVKGAEEAFDIPGDIDRTEDKAILGRLADATDQDFWGKGATYVNTTLQGWINEARERVRSDETPDKPPPSTPETIRAVAAEIASPTITLTNDQLDVITNTAFDGQTDTVNLDEAIAILRAVVAALLGGLPGNAPRSFAANLTIYDGELAKRDAKPFLGVLVRMEKSVSAGFHAEPELFDAGVATNFESYFDAHQEFMTHYRRNEEREAKIAQFKIDDAVASGIALTGPVDEVAKEVAALAEQGLVTEGYAQAVKEQQEINTQIALYSSSLPTPSGEPTAKERHILQTVGFYERSLAVATNIVSVSTQFAAFIIVLREAIAALLKFFV
jgi:hypothetical protein